MHYTEPIYRPPTEADDVFIQVTQGCSHNKCTFCGQYKDTPFHVEPEDQVEADIIAASQRYPDKTRVYLLSGDPFTLSFERLKRIGLLLNLYFPKLETVAMFATVNSVKRKTDEELQTLYNLKMKLFYMGIESGDPEAVAFAGKGHTVEDAYTQLKRLQRVGIQYVSAYIAGLLGDNREAGLRNAENTARFFNEVPPVLVGVSSLSIWDNTEIGRMRKAGTFKPASEIQLVEETRSLLAGLTAPVYFSNAHVGNLVTVSGKLPEDKEGMLSTMDDAIDQMKESGGIPRFDARDNMM